MAVVLQRHDRDEAVALTLAMRDSGDVLELGRYAGPALTSIRPAASATMSR
jgi:thymidine phosphorylase